MDKPLRLLGLARKAGRLAVGLDAVRESAGEAVLILTAKDAGSSAMREARWTAQKHNIPHQSLPYSREEIGKAVGKNLCAVAALTDSSFIFTEPR